VQNGKAYDYARYIENYKKCIDWHELLYITLKFAVFKKNAKNDNCPRHSLQPICCTGLPGMLHACSTVKIYCHREKFN